MVCQAAFGEVAGLILSVGIYPEGSQAGRAQKEYGSSHRTKFRRHQTLSGNIAQLGLLITVSTI